MNSHTEFDPPNEVFNCPKCKATCGTFYIESHHDCGDEECEKLHKKDELSCMTCGYATTGAKFANHLVKTMNLVTCPCCEGKGMIIKDVRVLG